MSTPNFRRQAALVALGLACGSARVAAQTPEVAPPPPQAAPPGPSNAPPFAVLLLSNGRILQGQVADDKAGTSYLVYLKGATTPIPLPKARVERRFATIADLYAYKVASLAPGDPDERMKLALWCLEYGMPAEAKAHLKALLEINPNDARAQRMVANLEASAERSEIAGRDASVRVAGAEMVESGPRELSPSVVPRPRGELGRAADRPVIFDLPPAVALRRAGEFRAYVQPGLVSACATCHNESHKGDFRLVAASRRATTPEIVRSNLDAVLRHVDRVEPSRSEILAYAIRPHGGEERPVLHGPNDPTYRTLFSWLAGLRPAATAPAPTPGSKPPAPPGLGVPTPSAFGGDRVSRAASPADLGPSRLEGLPAPAVPEGMPKNLQRVEVYELEAHAPGSEGATFTAPYLMGGPPPNPRARLSGPPPSVPLPPGGVKPMPGMPPLPKVGGIALERLPDGTLVPPPDDVIPPTGRVKKGKALDPALLEGVLKASKPTPP